MDAFIRRLRKALEELRAERIEYMALGQSIEMYQRSVGYIEALHNVQSEIDAILKQMME